MDNTSSKTPSQNRPKQRGRTLSWLGGGAALIVVAGCCCVTLVVGGLALTGVFGGEPVIEIGQESGWGGIFATSTATPTATPTITPTPTPTGGGAGRILFGSRRDGNYEIYIINADGSGLTNLTNHPADDFLSAWSPDGARIAFTSNRDDPDPEACSPACNDDIYVMTISDGQPPSSSEAIRLTDHPAEDRGPVWSPDGTRIAFMSIRDDPDFTDCGLECNREIYVVNVDGSGLINLTNSPDDDYAYDWSPDSEQIAFISTRDGNQEIYVVNADGSGLARLSHTHPSAESSPAWSPDGTRIAFYSSQEGNNDEIFIMNADGSEVIRLTDDPADDIFPTWSPDGSQLAFVSDRNEPNPLGCFYFACDHEIYVIDVPSGPDDEMPEPVQLTDQQTFISLPSWSPDGRWLAFFSPRDEPGSGGGFDFEVYVVSGDGTGLINLSNHPEDDFNPHWQP